MKSFLNLLVLNGLLIQLVLVGCDSEERSQSEFIDPVIPEFIFQVDFGSAGRGQEFWLDWFENDNLGVSERTQQAVFDQNDLTVRLTSCVETRTGGDKHPPKDGCDNKHQLLDFVAGGAVTATNIPDVLSDGVLIKTDATLDFDPLPRGSYEFKVFFHNATDLDLGSVELFVVDENGEQTLGAVAISSGGDASNAATINYKFDVLESKSMQFKFVCLDKGYIVNGFTLTKFFGEPLADIVANNNLTVAGQMPPSERDGCVCEQDDGKGDHGGKDKPDANSGRNDFNEPTRWSQFFGSGEPTPNSTDIAWASFNELPRLVGDVNADGLADMVGFASNGVYVALSNANKFELPRLWLVGFGSAVGDYEDQARFPRLLADVNGDKRADIVGFGPTGVEVGLAQEDNSFTVMSSWSSEFVGSSWPSQQESPRLAADHNGDGLADIIGINDEGVFVALNSGVAFADAVLAVTATELPNLPGDDLPVFSGDLTNDGRADLIAVGSNRLWFLESREELGFFPVDFGPRLFSSAQNWTAFDSQPRFVANFAGPTRASDLLGLRDGKMFISYDLEAATEQRELSGISSFLTSRDNLINYSFDRSPISFADVNGDRLLDVIFFQYDGVWVGTGRYAY